MNLSINRRVLLGTGAAALAVSTASATNAFAQSMPPAPTVQQLAKAPTMQNVSLSPDGTQIAYIVEQEGNKLLYHYNGKSKQFQTFNTGTNEIALMRWIDNEHLAVVSYFAVKKSAFMGLRDKYSQASIYNLTKKNLITLFDPLKDTSERTWWTGNLQRIVRDGKILIQTSGWRDERMLLVRFELDQQNYDIIDSGGEEVVGWATGPDGELIGRAEYYREKKTWTLNYRHGGGWKEIFTHKGELTIPSLLGLGRDGRTLLVYMEKDDNDGQYFEVDADGHFSDPLPAPGISRNALFDPLTFRLNGFVAFDGWFTYHYFDPVRADVAIKAQKAAEGYRMSIAEQADDPNIIILYTEGEDDAGTYYLINFSTGASMELGELYPDLPVEWITSKQAITYKAADGLDIEAYLTLPPNVPAQNLPLIMHPHGGPSDRDDMSYDWEVQAYASRGYAVLQPNFRGSDGYGYAFERAGDGQVGRKMQTDLSDGVRFLASKGIIDPKRVSIIGTSYGGYAALAGATLDTGVYNSAVSIAGLSDTVRWLEDERAGLAAITSPAYTYTKRLLGDEATLDDISPVKHIDKVSIPILIMHGKDDSVVSAYQSTTMVNALKAANKTVEYREVEHAEHGATTEASRIEMMTATLAFLDKYNPAKV